MTLHRVQLCLCLLALRDCRVRLGLHPIHGACPERGVYEAMEE